jgi:hypothetical protein
MRHTNARDGLRLMDSPSAALRCAAGRAGLAADRGLFKTDADAAA